MGDCRDAIADFKKKNNPKPVKMKRKRDSSKEIVQKKRKVTKESERSAQTSTIAGCEFEKFDSHPTSKFEITNSRSEPEIHYSEKSVLKSKSTAITKGWF